MFDSLKNAWKIADLRKKILYTLLIIFIFRLGSAIPVPFLNSDALSQMTSEGGNTLFGFLDVFTGGAFSRATIFALSITPYINSSIIMQLLTVAIPALERLAKEGEEGRKKIAQMTRYVTLVLGLILGIAYYMLLRNSNAVKYTTGFSGIFAAVVIVACFLAGTALIMWLGEQINQKGIGNGISLLIFAGIVSRAPSAVNVMVAYLALGPAGSDPVLFPGSAGAGNFHRGDHFYRGDDPGGKKNPCSIRQACGGQEDVRRPEQLYPDQSEYVRRYACHLRLFAAVSARHHQGLYQSRCRQLLGCGIGLVQL